MSKIYHPLPTFEVTGPSPYLHPPVLPETTNINETALSVMVDFRYLNPPIISPRCLLAQASSEMQLFHLPILLVVDEAKKLLGIVTSEDILGEKPVRISQERRIRRDKIEVSVIMTPVRELIAVDSEDLAHVKVAHLIQTFRKIRQHNFLVMEQAANPSQQKIRGLFSASLLSKQLDSDIDAIFSDTPITEL